jgi:ribosomal protein S8
MVSNLKASRVPVKNVFLSVSGYIGEFEIIDDHRSGKIVIQLNGHLNKTGVISPRFNIQHSQIESWVNLLLPARGFGILILVCNLYLHFSPDAIFFSFWLDHFFWNP